MQAANTFSPVMTQQYTDTETSSVGNLKSNIAAALCYFGPFGLIFLLMEKQSRLVRFHSVQALLYAVMLIALMVVVGIVSSVVALALGYIEPMLGFAVYAIAWFGVVAFAIGAPLYSMFNAYKGKMNKLPIVGRFAERAANK